MLKQLFKSFGSNSPERKDSPVRNDSPKRKDSPKTDIQREPEIISRDNHCISRKQISKNALTVIYDLRRAGFEAYLVGGGVRDLLLDLDPKDFDVATNATPEQVQQHFRRACIVGRRFKIAHVRFGREIIEVTTFRAAHNQLSASDANKKQPHSNKNIAQTNDHGMLLRDNVYGSLREDALRRDFTVNALYYSIDGFSVLDYVGGMADLQSRTLRIIGDAAQRYAEDPVRMLRAIRFKAKFDFDFETQTAAPLTSMGHLLQQVAPPRLFDEIIKLLLSGKGLKTYELLCEYQLFDSLFPGTAKLLNNSAEADAHHDMICSALSNTDQRIKEDKPVTPAFLYAALLWPQVSEEASVRESEGAPRLRALQIAGHNAIDAQMPIIAIPKRFSIASREIWTLQQRLETANGKRAIAVLQHPRFRAAYDFLLLREQNGEQLNQRGEFWTQLQEEHPLNSRSGTDTHPGGNDRGHNNGRPRRRRRSRKPNKQKYTDPKS